MVKQVLQFLFKKIILVFLKKTNEILNPMTHQSTIP